ncbi:hypothetical protein N8768_05190 [Flavobacteriaceae bacterium]|jgi:hypothetical protein|nr:hypothetical protein [Flavobacteriaceae bacterium]
MISSFIVIRNSVVFCLIIFLFGCLNTEKLESNSIPQISSIDSSQVTTQNISNLKYTEYVLSDISKIKVRDWQKLNDLMDIIEEVKLGNLSFLNNDKVILDSFFTDLKNEIPESIKSTSILVRLTVIETLFLKLEGIMSLKFTQKENLLKNIKDILVSHSNLILQLNKKFEKESQNIKKPN